MNKTLKSVALALTVMASSLGALFVSDGLNKEPVGGVGVYGAFEEAEDAVLLKQGDSGSDVKEIQQKLKNWGYYFGSVDGIYGSATKEAIKKFQEKNGLQVDGVCGEKTLNALGIVKNTSPDKNGGYNSYSSSDLYLLAKVIHAEGRGESYTGQVAIGAVVLNRVESEQFPNTISGVVYQKHAFTAVSDGQINLEPNETAMRAAKDAMNGWDPTYGCLYYYNPAIATSSWIFSRETVTVIGKHVFAI